MKDRIKLIAFIQILAFLGYQLWSLVGLVWAINSPWSQTDWSGGSGQASWSETNKFSSATNISFDTTNEIELNVVGNSWYNVSWNYRKKITFDNNEQAEPLNDFTVLVRLTSINFDFSRAKNTGEDIRFTDTDGTTLLSYEIESWSAADQEAWIWVKIPQIDASSDTDFIYVYYGNNEAEDAQNINDTWDSNFVGVWHLAEISGNYLDSTVLGNGSTVISGVARDGDGKVNGGPLFVKANGDFVNFGDIASVETQNITLEAWVKTKDNTLSTNGGIAKGYIYPGGAEASWSLDFASNQAVWRLNNESDVTFGSNSISIGDNDFHYWVGQYDGSVSSLYKDGVGITKAVVDIIDYTKTYNSFAIGGRYGAGSHFSIDGYIDEVRVSDIARSDEWIAAQYKSINQTFNTYGVEEGYVSTADGSLTSSILDTEQQSDWGVLSYGATLPTNTSVEVRIRSSNNASMTGATTFSSCTPIISGEDISSSTCVSDTHRYIQYQVVLTNSDLTSTPTFSSISLNFSISTNPEQRAVWLQDDSNLDTKLTALRNAHFNTVYFGAWGADNLGIQAVIDKIHEHGMEAHIWESNSSMCAGHWQGNCTVQNNSSWYARLPNGMSSNDWNGGNNWIDFGVEAAKDYVVDYMVDYASNYNADGIHYDYIRYDYEGNWSYNQDNLDDFETEYGVAPEVVRGDKFPAFYGRVAANRLTTLTTATSLVEYQDGVPAVFINNRGNGQVLTFNTQAYAIYAKVFDTVMTRAIEEYGSSDLYVLSNSVNSGTYGGYNLTSRWLGYLGYSPLQTTVDGIASLPSDSLLVIPAVYSFTAQVITDMDNLLANGGDIIFVDGPTTSALNSATFRSILGTSTGSSYFNPGNALFSITNGSEDNAFVTGLDRGDDLSYEQASIYIDNWKTIMQGKITQTVKEVSDILSVSNPDVKISAAVFPAEDESNTRNIHQDWTNWIDNGYLDYGVIMGYTLNNNTFNNRIDWVTTNNYQNRVILGLGPYLMTNCDQSQTILDQIHQIRTNNIRGYSLFQSNSLTQSGQTAADCGMMSDLTTLYGINVDVYYPTLPYIPGNLSTYRTDGVTEIVTGGVTNQASTILKFEMTSQDVSDTLTPQIEIRPVDEEFLNIVTNIGTSMVYSGSTIIGSVTVTNLSEGESYHWQARIGNSIGYSTWMPAGGNPDFFIETTPPSVTVNQAVGQSDSTSESLINFTVEFSEAVLDFGSEDVTLGGTSGATTVVVTGSGSSYNLAVSGMTQSGTVLVSIAADKVHDAAGNGNTISSSTDNSVDYVVIIPSPTPTPTSTLTPTSTTSNNTSVSHPAPNCNDQVPGVKTPWLYGATAQSSDKILLSFTASDDPVDKYVLEYGKKSGEYIYGVLDMGVNSRSNMTFLVGSLSPNTSYNFRIRGGNGCATGEWSNEISTKTKGLVSLNQLEVKRQDMEVVGVEKNKKVETVLDMELKENIDEISKEELTGTEGKQIPKNTVYDVVIRVVDTNKEPVDGAKVTIHSLVQEAFTDKNGIVKFKNVEAGDHKVLIAYSGYTGEQSINLAGDVKEFDLTVTVEQESLSLSPFAFGIIGIMGVIMIVLIWVLLKKKNANSQNSFNTWQVERI